MGFLRDWKAHWHYMGLECRELCHSMGKRPLHSLKVMWTHPLMFAFWWFIAALYWNGVASVATGRTGGINEPTLRDQGFSFPKYQNYDLNNYLLFATVGVTLIRFLPIWPCTKPALARTILRRWLFLEGLLFWFRAVSVVVTSQPKPDPECEATATESVWVEAIYITFGKTYTCADCMFSGHTAAVTLFAMIWTHYSRGEEFAICFGKKQGIITANVDAAGDPMGVKLIDIVAWAWAIHIYYWIIATRFHYSTDVVIGFIICWLLFHCYHFYIKVLPMRQGSMFSRFMRWFEGIDSAAATLVREQETGRHTAALGTNLALKAGHDVVKSNATLGGDDLPVAALPVSYLEGTNYYRADLVKEVGSGYTNKSTTEDHHRRFSEEMNTHEQPTAITQAPLPATHPAGANADVGGVHNHQLPVPVLVTGEYAAQEHRDVRREKNGQI